MKKTLITLIAIVAVSPLFAEEPPPIVEAAHNQVVRFLDLSEEQVLAWHEIYQIHRETELPLQEEIAVIQALIEELFEAGDPDPYEIGELMIDRRELGEALIEVHIVYHEAFVALLDETQMRRLRFIARADDVQKTIPAFKLFELIPRR